MGAIGLLIPMSLLNAPFFAHKNVAYLNVIFCISFFKRPQFSLFSTVNFFFFFPQKKLRRSILKSSSYFNLLINYMEFGRCNLAWADFRTQLVREEFFPDGI